MLYEVITKEKKLPKHVSVKVSQEFKKLKFMQPMSAEATVVRNYIDTILSLPWYERTKSRITSYNVCYTKLLRLEFLVK